MEEGSSLIFHPGLRNPKDEKNGGFVKKKVYWDDVVVYEYLYGDTVTKFSDGDIHNEHGGRDKTGVPKFEPVNKSIGALAIVDACFMGDQGSIYIVGGMPRLWCGNDGCPKAYDYITSRILTAEETAYRLTNLANHPIVDLA